MNALSEREHLVAEQYCKGLADKEVADRLGRSTWTIKAQKRDIYRKLGISKDTELPVYVMRKAENQLRPEGDSQTWAGNILLIPLFSYGGYRLPCGHEKMPDADKSKSNQSNKEESRWRLTHGS